MAEQEREMVNFGWCIVEVFGHRKLGAQCREVPVAGRVMLRCDIPGGEGTEPFTQFYGASALFCVSPCSEVAARTVAARYAQPPIQRYELPAPRATRSEVEDADADEPWNEPWEDEDDDGSDEPGAANPGDEIDEALDDLEEIPPAPSVAAQVQPGCGHNPPDTSCPICYPF